MKTIPSQSLWWALPVLFLTLVLPATAQTVVDTVQVNDTATFGGSGDVGKFEWRDNGILVSKGISNQGALLLSDQGAGNRLLWYPKKAAFRAGLAIGTEWDENNIGFGSVAFGYSSLASGAYSFTFGSFTEATSIGSVAFGSGSNAEGHCSLAGGEQALASGTTSVSIGAQTTALGANSVAIGYDTIAKAAGSLALGYFNVGYGSEVASDEYGEFFLEWLTADPILEIGNGTWNYQTGAPNRSNAVTILKKGEIRSAGVVQARDGVRVPPKGDLSMGSFTSGKNPATLNPQTGLRYADE